MCIRDSCNSDFKLNRGKDRVATIGEHSNSSLGNLIFNSNESPCFIYEKVKGSPLFSFFSNPLQSSKVYIFFLISTILALSIILFFMQI
jgi:hypothetical protein